MSHCKPHLERGLCLCDCRKCTLELPYEQELCICPDCDAPRCGLHVSPAQPLTE